MPLTVAPAPPGYTSLVNPEYIGHQLVVVSVVCTALSTIFVLLRLYTRQVIVRNMGWDEFWIICAWVCFLINCIMEVGFHDYFSWEDLHHIQG